MRVSAAGVLAVLVMLDWLTEVDVELRAAGILVRSMAGKPLIDGCFRVSIGTTSQMQRFMEAFLPLER